MDIETTLNKCDFGEAIGDECHKLSYTRIQNMENLRDYSEDVQETPSNESRNTTSTR